MRLLAVPLLALSLAGCSLIEEVLLSPSEKINRAFPPQAAVRASEEALDRLLEHDAAARQSLAARYQTLREIRGLTCGRDLVIGRFDSVAEVSQLPVSRDCLNEQDQILLRFLQIKQIERRLAQPALRPLTPLGAPTLVAPGVPLVAGVAASAAGVAVLRGTRGEHLAVEIPSGKPIVRLPTVGDAPFHNALLSPNGRVLALPAGHGGGVVFLDMETGTPLWEERNIQQLLAWLPELSAALVTTADGGLAAVDLRAGELTGVLPALKRLTWAVNLPDGTLAAGTGRSVVRLGFARSAARIEGTLLKTHSLQRGAGVTSLRPTAMLDGRALVFVSMRDLMKLDLQTGEETLWKTGEFIANRYAKLSESTLLVDAYERPVSSSAWVLDIEKATLAPVETAEGNSGILQELDGRLGFLRRTHDGIWFGLDQRTGSPLPLEDFLSARNLALQEAKLATMTRESSRQPGYPAPYAYPHEPGRGPAIEAPPSPPPFAALAKGARIEGVGVYESVARRPNGPGNRPGEISLTVRPSSDPTILVLSSYESITWRITSGQQHLKLILLSSYYPSRVEGAGDVRVVVINGGHAYNREGADYARLRRAVLGQTGRDLEVFQGSYQGAHFMVGDR